MEKLPQDELNRLLGLLGDIIDGLELVQALYADPLIESSAGRSPLRQHAG